MPYLSHGQQVFLAELGHFDMPGNDQPQAVERLLTSFYDTGVADDSLYTYAPINFRVSWGYPTQAKLLLGLVLLLIAAVVAVIWSVVRRVQRRKARQAAN